MLIFIEYAHESVFLP